MNEQQSPHHSQSKVVCRNFLGLWRLKHWRIRITYRQRRSNFPRRERKLTKVTYSVALLMAFLAAENENWPLEDLPQADLVFVVINAFNHLEPWRQPTVRFLFGDCRFLYFHSLIRLAFFVSKELLCLYDKQNNTRLLVCNSTSHLLAALTRELSI